MAEKRVLLVEGTDDEHVFKHICGERGVGKLDEIKPHGNDLKLLEAFPVRLKESEISAVGVVLDADTDLPARWQALKHRLVAAGYTNTPDQPALEGTILTPPPATLLPRFGVWIMPDNRSSGILEDFLQFLVPGESPLFGHAKSSVQGIPLGERRFTDLAEPKAIIHTWLAWQKEPGKPFGTAITAKFLDPNVPQVDVLVRWLKQLFFP